MPTVSGAADASRRLGAAQQNQGKMRLSFLHRRRDLDFCAPYRLRTLSPVLSMKAGRGEDVSVRLHYKALRVRRFIHP